MKPFLHAWDEYESQERDRIEIIDRYLHDNKRNYVKPVFNRSDLSKNSSRRMYAINGHSRLLLARQALGEVEVKLDELRSQGVTEVFQLTLTPGKFALGEKSASEFKPQRFLQMVSKWFPDVSMFGMIEAALFPRYYLPEAEEGIVSFHSHTVVWGVSERTLRRLAAAYCQHYPCAVMTMKSAFVQKVEIGEVLDIVGYELKSPANSYDVSRFDVPRIDKETGEFLLDPYEKLRKQELRTGQRVQLCNAMCELYLPDLVVAQGEGNEVLRRVQAVLPGMVPA